MARRQKTAVVAPREDEITAADCDWRSVEGFPAYEVSSNGLVRNVRTWHVLKPEVGHRGHLRVTLFNEQGKKRLLAHRLVLQHFIGPSPGDGRDDCAHWDGEPANNSVSNLRWATKKENAEDARRHGTLPVGDKCHFSKLGAAQVLEIRNRAAAGASTSEIAAEFGLVLSNVNRIVCGKGWRHLGGPIRQSIPRSKVDEHRAIEAVEAVKEGASYSEAARRTGVSRKTIRHRLAPEKLIHQAVIDHWRALREPNTLVATLANAGAMGQPGLTPGLADLVVFAPGLPVGFIELKRDYDSPMSDAQRDFAALCLTLGVRYALCYGRDEPIQLLEIWRAVRKQADAA